MEIRLVSYNTGTRSTGSVRQGVNLCHIARAAFVERSEQDFSRTQVCQVQVLEVQERIESLSFAGSNRSKSFVRL